MSTYSWVNTLRRHGCLQAGDELWFEGVHGDLAHGRVEDAAEDDHQLQIVKFAEIREGASRHSFAQARVLEHAQTCTRSVKSHRWFQSGPLSSHQCDFTDAWWIEPRSRGRSG